MKFLRSNAPSPVTTAINHDAAPHPAPAPRSPEREGLALAIARRDKAKRELELIAKGLSVYSEKKFDARRAVEVAEAGVEQATIDQSKYAIDVAFGNPATPPITSKEARSVLDDARDTLAVIMETMNRLGAARTEWEASLRWAEQHVISARASVIRSDPAVQALLDRFLALQAELGAAREILDFLGRFSAPGKPIIQAFMNERTKLAAVSPWRTFYSGLLDDADAAPPSL